MRAKQGLLRGAALALATAAGVGHSHLMFEESTPIRGKTRRRGKKVEITFDRAGMPHGISGCKLARKAMQGTVGGHGRRGFLDGWSSTKVGAMGIGERRRPSTPRVAIPRPVSARQARIARKALKRTMATDAEGL